MHRNQAEPSEQNKLSAVEERGNMGTFFSCVQGTGLFCFLIAACALQKTGTLLLRVPLSRNWVLLTDSG